MSKNETTYLLYYDVSCALCRQIKILMEENKLNYKVFQYRPLLSLNQQTYSRVAQNFSGNLEKDFLVYNLSRKLPFMQITLRNLPTSSGASIHSDTSSLISTAQDSKQYYAYGMNHCLSLINKDNKFLPSSFDKKILTNNILYLLNNNFHDEVTTILIYEKITKYSLTKQNPDISNLNIARKRFSEYLKMFLKLINDNNKLTSETMSIADIALAAHLSILDYINEINWDEHQTLKEWYLVMKSRPSFRKVLNDFIPGFTPASHYQELDF